MIVSVGDAVEQYSESAIETEGDFKTEDDSKAAFLQAIEPANCFNIYSEVDCWYFGGSVFGDKPTGRVDFVLSPRKPLIELGWRMGLIGIECKKSGHKAGPLICQMIDYSKSICRLPVTTGSALVCMTSVCCFPGFSCFGAIESVMANHRLGTVVIRPKHARFNIGGANIFTISDDNKKIVIKNINCGYKNGSR